MANKYNFWGGIFFLLALSMLAGCSSPKELVYKDVTNLEMGKLGFGASTLKFDVVYYNPNNFGLKLKKTELDIYINNTFLGHTVQDQQIAIPKKADFAIPITVAVDMKNIYKNLFSALFNSEVMVKAVGKVTVGKAGIFKSFPVNYEGKQKISM